MRDAREQWTAQATALKDANRVQERANDLTERAQHLEISRQMSDLDSAGADLIHWAKEQAQGTSTEQRCTVATDRCPVCFMMGASSLGRRRSWACPQGAPSEHAALEADGRRLAHATAFQPVRDVLSVISAGPLSSATSRRLSKL